MAQKTMKRYVDFNIKDSSEYGVLSFGVGEGASSIATKLKRALPIPAQIVLDIGVIATGIAAIIAKKKNIKAIRVTYIYDYVKGYWTEDGACINVYILNHMSYSIIHA